MGFGSSQTGSSSSYDRHIYMDNAGHVIFGVYNAATFTLATVGTYNNGAWHHVVGTLSGNGMTLYVDGKKIGVNQGTTIAQDYTGYWRVGGDNLGSWPSAPSSAYFKGSIDEVSIYPTALTTAQVQAHYVNSGRTLTVPAVPSDTYGAAVYQSSPEIYWRLDDATGTAADDSSVNGAPGVYAGGVTKGVTSPVSGATGTAVTFNGSNGTVGSSQSYVNPSTYSEELWFSTTTTRGGKLIGFGNRQSGNSTSHDRDVYMLNSGQLVFGVNATPVTLTTPAAYNDGKWHHLVATQGNAGMRLYVDGQLVGSNTTTTAQNYTGYWRVGGDAGVTSTSAYLAGTIDEVAVYSTALTPAQVRAHYRASAAAVNALPVAAFASSCTNLGCSFDGSASADADGSIAGYAWDFGDGATGTVAATSHTYTAAGTYPVVLTVTDDLGATSSVTHTVTVAPPPNVLPTAAFSSSASYLHAAFDANGSSDPDGSIASYAWDFGDGTTGTGVAPSHIYTAGGTYEVTLTVTDNRDGATSLTQALTVAANQAPVAAFTPTCTNLGCSFDGRESIDGDGSIVSYAWDFGDGATSAGATASRTYTAAGTFAVTLTVTDDQGATGSVSHTVTVAPPPNVPPIAAFTSSASYLHAAFNANGSSDPDGSIASYAWDFGDSTTGTGVAPSHTYAAGGTYQVELTVTDNRDGTTSVTHGAHRRRQPGAGGSVHADLHEPGLLVRRPGICRCRRVNRRLCLDIRRRGNRHWGDGDA